MRPRPNSWLPARRAADGQSNLWRGVVAAACTAKPQQCGRRGGMRTAKRAASSCMRGQAAAVRLGSINLELSSIWSCGSSNHGCVWPSPSSSGRVRPRRADLSLAFLCTRSSSPDSQARGCSWRCGRRSARGDLGSGAVSSCEEDDNFRIFRFSVPVYSVCSGPAVLRPVNTFSRD
jgi:hypothetical protein